MNIFVVSDTHGNIDKTVEFYDRVSAGIDFDMLIHCGDFMQDAIIMEKEIGIRTVSVRGNCDGCREREFRMIETPGPRILVTHGHMENVKFSLMNLVYLAKEQKCDLACYGHTHMASKEQVNGITLLNPGSISMPRDGSSGTAAMIVATAGNVASTILHY